MVCKAYLTNCKTDLADKRKLIIYNLKETLSLIGD